MDLALKSLFTRFTFALVLSGCAVAAGLMSGGWIAGVGPKATTFVWTSDATTGVAITYPVPKWEGDGVPPKYLFVNAVASEELAQSWEIRQVSAFRIRDGKRNQTFEFGPLPYMKSLERPGDIKAVFEYPSDGQYEIDFMLHRRDGSAAKAADSAEAIQRFSALEVEISASAK